MAVAVAVVVVVVVVVRASGGEEEEGELLLNGNKAWATRHELSMRIQYRMVPVTPTTTRPATCGHALLRGALFGQRSARSSLPHTLPSS